MTNWASLLNPEQCAAVTAPDGPLLVLAAAGTGKTRTLTYRVAYLMENGVRPENILLLTFTNRAAREMLERAEQLVGPAIATLWSGTFHHVCHRILRVYAERLGYTRSFVILDREDSLSLINKAIKALVSNVKEFPKKDVMAALIGKVANTEGDLAAEAAALSLETGASPEQIVAVAERYQADKRAANAMDFDDLLTNTLKLLRQAPEVLARYAERFRYILVDEYQDTNTIQSQIVDLLASHHRNLMAVGDDFQCIYTWRGADFRNIMDFPKRWAGCQIIKLERNYRSVPEILSVANDVIAGNPEQFQKTLLPTRPAAGVKPLLTFLRDASEQSQMVIRQVQRLLADGLAPTDIAILYRSHYHVMELETELRRLQIDYVLTSGQGFYDSAHVKDTVSFLRLCSGTADLFAFTRVMGLLPGVGPKTAEKLWAKLGERFDATQPPDRQALLTLMPKKARPDWEVLDAILGRYQEENLEFNGSKAVTLFQDAWYDRYLHRAYENAEERIEDLAALASQFGKNQSVGQFLYDVALMTNVDAESAQALADRPGLHLSTVHQAKGLEWPAVIILWCNEDLFPSARAIKEGNEAEERRLFYVAVTRAKRSLLLCTPSYRFNPRSGERLYLKPSRFVKALPESLVSKRYGMY
ncbi:MAG: ATP-dependent helicase [Candidatus Spyradenecus sp.]